MNVTDNHLIRVGGDGAIPEGYFELPAELRQAANKLLGVRDSATVSKSSGGKLSKWASAQRKARRQAQKESRRRNRV